MGGGSGLVEEVAGREHPQRPVCKHSARVRRMRTRDSEQSAQTQSKYGHCVSL